MANPFEGSSSILAEAQKIVEGARNEDYGTPHDTHSRTAALWNAYISKKGGKLNAFDVCMLNILQKVSRLAHKPTRDGLVDIAGYALNAEIVSIHDQQRGDTPSQLRPERAVIDR